MDWIYVTQGRGRWWGVVNVVMNLWVSLSAEYLLTSWGTVSFSGRTLLRGVKRAFQSIEVLEVYHFCVCRIGCNVTVAYRYNVISYSQLVFHCNKVDVFIPYRGIEYRLPSPIDLLFIAMKPKVRGKLPLLQSSNKHSDPCNLSVWFS